MRERITYVQKLGDSLEPSAITIDGGKISGPEVHAVREDRLTIALDELPSELRALLKDAQELHIRWVSTTPYEAISPLLARLPPGFHVFFTPRREEAVFTSLCATLAKIFGDLSCSTPAESFTSLPQDRFPHAPALQYFQQLDSLSHFIHYAQDQLCRATDAACLARLGSLSKASSLDIDYDTTSRVLRATATWPYQRQPVEATSRPQLRTEVGILSTDKPQTLEPHEIGISGLLTVLGQDANPSPTMFTFVSRHRDAESSFSARFLRPTGFHPTLQLRLTSPDPPPSASAAFSPDHCSLHAYLTLPRPIFADKYQLADPIFLASKNLSALRYTTQPVDLEAPAYVLPQWGSAVLLDLSPPRAAEKTETEDGRADWTAEIPLHLRYLPPAQGGYESVHVPYPAVFWACEPEQEDEEVQPPGPFERSKLGYDGLFAEGTVFWHVEPRSVEGNQRLVNDVGVPVLDLERAGWVNVGTAVAVAVGFAWVVWKLVGVWRGEAEKKGTQGEKKRQ
ncbi:PIG-X-domain-containing protein [Trichocladium antarcticum]|uniref:Protein PBN1 n=1 Tax=Trichocladium antarcticum TaxID=1450529 RepID=A0AAN6ZF62_9PEZI|nr:PIG-X-domain-containing protein [Trichocladium antarcticum]